MNTEDICESCNSERRCLKLGRCINHHGSGAAPCSEANCQYFSVPPISSEAIAATLDLIENALLGDQWKPEAKTKFQEMADHLGSIPQNDQG